eukprot:TRINITY_DN4249_c0_g1_i2.p1 TRINITY_DN4249_c0_g1~~TRINITY_DN4249_c0_g1_i2.p1  ORF type:complete len:121 (-),score=7.98 TRINITY_DN4249_c0_g1_i2:68-430(-)
MMSIFIRINHDCREIYKLVTTSLGFVAALAWNSAIQALFNSLLGRTAEGIAGLFLYALIISLITVVSVYLLGKATLKLHALEKKASTKLKRVAKAIPTSPLSPFSKSKRGFVDLPEVDDD